MKAYLASHFFNEAGFDYTKKVAQKIRKEIPELDLYVPQDNSDINDKEKNDSKITASLIAQADNNHLKESNILIANIDGVEIDSGVSAEIGYMAGLIEAEKESPNPFPRIILGLYTDMRQNGSGENFFYINLYTKGLILSNGQLIDNTEDLILLIKKFIKNNKP